MLLNLGQHGCLTMALKSLVGKKSKMSLCLSRVSDISNWVLILVHLLSTMLLKGQTMETACQTLWSPYKTANIKYII